MWCITYIISLIPTTNQWARCHDPPSEVEPSGCRRPCSSPTHTPHYMSAARRKPIQLDSRSQTLNLYSIQTPIVKLQNYLHLTLAFEFLKIWFVVLAFKWQNFHVQRWPEIPYWLHEGNRDQRFLRIFRAQLTVSSTD